MPQIALIEPAEFQRLRADAGLETNLKLALLADMARANALTAVKRAGSGHLGSSFSAMDIVTLLYDEVMNTLSVGLDQPGRDIYFSSKGHDVPGFYASMHAHGVIPSERLLMLRRLGGLDGHPDVAMPGVEANSGSLGMGISKGRGMAWAKRHRNSGGHVYVLTGDGELQEGQIYESLQSTVQQGITNLTVIVDHNKLQSDREIHRIVNLGDLERKFAAFGWHVRRCDGHDFDALRVALAALREDTARPGILIADTIKGRGVSFMEHPQALKDAGGFYRFHAGAPADELYERAHAELLTRINQRLTDAGRAPVTLTVAPPLVTPPSGVTPVYVADAYGQALVELGREFPQLVVLDADLSLDCRLRGFEDTFPDRFIENGIAEQDMTSMAGGLALQGFLPVVNSFASFLASRANEHIYNNASEKTRILYGLHYAGLIPAGPGKSHQSIRDISLLAALPNMVIVQPCNGDETKALMRYAVTECRENFAIRLIIGPSPRVVELPQGYQPVPGQGVALTDGKDATLLAYGPVMLHEALNAADQLKNDGFGLRVIHMPWLNRADRAWYRAHLGGTEPLFVVEDHAPIGGLGDFVLRTLNGLGLMNGRTLSVWGVEGYPAFGTPAEALRHHRLDAATLARRVRDGN